MALMLIEGRYRPLNDGRIFDWERLIILDWIPESYHQGAARVKEMNEEPHAVYCSLCTQRINSDTSPIGLHVYHLSCKEFKVLLQ